jgi:two-component system, OmpR family, sensor kinase
MTPGRLRFRSIRTRFTLWGISSFVLLPLIALLLSDLVSRAVFTPAVDRALVANARGLARALEPCAPGALGQSEGALAECLDRALRRLFPRQVAYVQLRRLPVGSGGQPPVLARSYALMSLSWPLSPDALRALARREPCFESLPPYDFDSYNRIVTIVAPEQGAPGYVIQFGLDLFVENHAFWSGEALTKRPHLFFAMLPFLLLGASLWAFFFMKRVFAPVHEIVALARRITVENLSQRIEGVESRDEIGELVETLNAMIARLGRSFQQIEQFSSDVAHELRTPLTIIKGEVEVALKRERDGVEYRKVLASLQEEAERLAVMVEDLLLLARMDARAEPARFGAVDLDALVLETCEETAAQARAREVLVVVERLDEVQVAGEPGLLKRLLVNLLRNALHYTGVGGRVTVALVATAGDATLEISDTGCGIPEEALPHIFDRFYRVDPARAHETGGVGLGLALVRKIADVHQARVEVRSKVGEGSTFRVSLPRVQVPEPAQE